jgi:hypothetical protein
MLTIRPERAVKHAIGKHFSGTDLYLSLTSHGFWSPLSYPEIMPIRNQLQVHKMGTLTLRSIDQVFSLSAHDPNEYAFVSRKPRFDNFIAGT